MCQMFAHAHSLHYMWTYLHVTLVQTEQLDECEPADVLCDFFLICQTHTLKTHPPSFLGGGLICSMTLPGYSSHSGPAVCVSEQDMCVRVMVETNHLFGWIWVCLTSPLCLSVAALQMFWLFLALLCFWFLFVCLEQEGLCLIHHGTFEEVRVKTLCFALSIKLSVPFHSNEQHEPWCLCCASCQAEIRNIVQCAVWKNDLTSCNLWHQSGLNFTTGLQLPMCSLLVGLLGLYWLLFFAKLDSKQNICLCVYTSLK